MTGRVRSFTATDSLYDLGSPERGRAAIPRAARWRQPLQRLVPVILILALTGCPASAPPDRKAYTTIENATLAVQGTVRVYKRSCGVQAGQAGPGSCDTSEYQTAERAYSVFQKVALEATFIAEKTGQTPLEVISSAAGVAIEVVLSMKKGGQ